MITVVGVGVVGENIDFYGRAFGGRSEVIAGYRVDVAFTDVDGDGRDIRIGEPVIGLVGEGCDAVDVGRRNVVERAVEVELERARGLRHAAVVDDRRPGDQGDGQFVALLLVLVIVEDTGCRLIELDVFIEIEIVVDGNRCVVNGDHQDIDRAVDNAAVAVADRISEAVGTEEVAVWCVGEGAVEIVHHRTVGRQRKVDDLQIIGSAGIIDGAVIVVIIVPDIEGCARGVFRDDQNVVGHFRIVVDGIDRDCHPPFVVMPRTVGNQILEGIGTVEVKIRQVREIAVVAEAGNAAVQGAVVGEDPQHLLFLFAGIAGADVGIEVVQQHVERDFRILVREIPVVVGTRQRRIRGATYEQEPDADNTQHPARHTIDHRRNSFPVSGREHARECAAADPGALSARIRTAQRNPCRKPR